MNLTSIEYLDLTWNPITGCQGLDCAVRQRCWARRMAQRLRGRYGYPQDDPFKPTFHSDRWIEPFRRKKPARIGVCFMGDLYDVYWVGSRERDQVFVAMEKAYWHTYLTLTKQPQNMPPLPFYSPNIWQGVSVNTRKDLWRIHALTTHQAEVHYASFEPLLEELGPVNLEHIEWVIIGAQTRPTVTPEKSWVDNIHSKAKQLGIPVFLKNNLGLEDPTQEFPKEK